MNNPEVRDLQSLRPMSVEYSQVGWDDVKRFLRTYYRLILVIFVATVLSAYVCLNFMTELYSAEAELLVKIGRENLDPPATSRNLPLTTGLRHEEVTSEIAMLQSPGLLASVVDEVGVDAFKPVRIRPNDFLGKIKFDVKAVARAVKEQYEETLITLDLKKRLDDRQKAIQSLSSNLEVEPRKESDVIELRLKMPDPALAVKLENLIVANYLVRRIEVRQNNGVEAFLTESAEQRHKALAGAEATKAGWKAKQGLVSAGEQKALLLQQVRDLESQSGAAQREIESVTQQIAATKGMLETVPTFQKSIEQENPNPIANSLKERLIDRQAERLRLLAKYAPESVPVGHIDDEIKELRNMLAKEEATQHGPVTSQLNPGRQVLEQKLQQDTVRLEGLKVTASMLQTQSGQLSAELSRIDKAEGTLSTIDRNVTMAEQDFLAINKRRQDAVVDSELNKKSISNVSVLAAPSATFDPVYPKKLLIMAISLVVGLVGSIGIALLAFYLKDVVDEPEEVERTLQLPLLGSVSLEKEV